jgi:hypothetical protein
MQPGKILHTRMNMFIEYDYEGDLANYYEHRIGSLERKRVKITCRGKLSASEDRMLHEIDSEIMYWIDCLDVLSEYWYEDEDVV